MIDYELDEYIIAVKSKEIENLMSHPVGHTLPTDTYTH